MYTDSQKGIHRFVKDIHECIYSLKHLAPFEAKKIVYYEELFYIWLYCDGVVIFFLVFL